MSEDYVFTVTGTVGADDEESGIEVLTELLMGIGLFDVSVDQFEKASVAFGE